MRKFRGDVEKWRTWFGFAGWRIKI